jgi:hypothetical protein
VRRSNDLVACVEAAPSFVAARFDVMDVPRALDRQLRVFDLLTGGRIG